MKKVRMIVSAAVVLAVVSSALAFTPRVFTGQCLFHDNAGCKLIKEVASGTGVSDTGALVAKPSGGTCDDATVPSSCSASINYNNE